MQKSKLFKSCLFFGSVLLLGLYGSGASADFPSIEGTVIASSSYYCVYLGTSASYYASVSASSFQLTGYDGNKLQSYGVTYYIWSGSAWVSTSWNTQTISGGVFYDNIHCNFAPTFNTQYGQSNPSGYYSDLPSGNIANGYSFASMTDMPEPTPPDMTITELSLAIDTDVSQLHTDMKFLMGFGYIFLFLLFLLFLYKIFFGAL